MDLRSVMKVLFAIWNVVVVAYIWLFAKRRRLKRNNELSDKLDLRYSLGFFLLSCVATVLVNIFAIDDIVHEEWFGATMSMISLWLWLEITGISLARLSAVSNRIHSETEVPELPQACDDWEG